jgi:hypothetical protein
VTSVTVSDEFEKKRTLLVINSPFPGIFDCLPSGDYVHSVDLWNFKRLEFVRCVTNDKDDTYPEARDFVTASVVVGVGGAAGGGGAHTVLVVLADENGGEIPQFGLEFMSNGGK